MKRIGVKFRSGILFVAAVAIIFFTAQIFLSGCGNTKSERYDLIRIHIRADSNLPEAQSVKLEVRDSISRYLTCELVGITDFAEAYSKIGARISSIEQIASAALRSAGFGYNAKARLNNEYFPTRTYDGVVVVSGYYDALIVELGEAKGDNWWCVIYPPLCYIESGGGGEGFKYTSWIAELYEKYFKK